MLMKTKTVEFKEPFKSGKKIIDLSKEELRIIDLQIKNRIRKEIEENEQQNFEGLQAIRNIRVKGSEKDREL